MASEERTQTLEAEVAALTRRCADLEASEAQIKKAEEALSDAVWQWQATFNAISDGICMLDEEGFITRCNRAFLSLVGRDSREIVGKRCFEMVHGASEPPEFCPVAKMKTSGGRETAEYAVGSRWFRVIADPIFDENGHITSAVHIIADTSEQRRAEEALRESEALYRSLVEALPHAVVVLKDGEIAFANDAAVTVFGYGNAAELKARGLFFGVAEHEKDRLTGIVRRRLAGEKVPEHYFTDFVRKDGTEFPAEVFARVATWRGAPAVQAVIMDLSARNALGA
ncbi:MAG: PAS domain S-box protein [Deltaproteobacteria bacterium]|nr:PAS domain S-box protein [Deltaproteobacteria bacterium]